MLVISMIVGYMAAEYMSTDDSKSIHIFFSLIWINLINQFFLSLSLNWLDPDDLDYYGIMLANLLNNRQLLSPDKRSCLRRGSPCDHRPNDCCPQSSKWPIPLCQLCVFCFLFSGCRVINIIPNIKTWNWTREKTKKIQIKNNSILFFNFIYTMDYYYYYENIFTQSTPINVCCLPALEKNSHSIALRHYFIKDFLLDDDHFQVKHNIQKYRMFEQEFFSLSLPHFKNCLFVIILWWQEKSGENFLMKMMRSKQTKKKMKKKFWIP